MIEILFIVGVFVFFISVYGAVVIGGHLLEELGGEDGTSNRSSLDGSDATIAAATA
ncbi:MAG: hypothetical protein ABIO83_03240 [Ilumatobacteraceae bacterium]